MVKAMVRHEGTFLMALSLVALSFGCAAQSPSLQEFLRNQEMQRADLLQSQRTIAELHAEKQLLQRDLGAARASQARLDGTLRETDRQLHDARYIVDIQREELAKAREERERLAQASQGAQTQLVELGRLRQQAEDAERERARLQAALDAALSAPPKADPREPKGAGAKLSIAPMVERKAALPAASLPKQNALRTAPSMAEAEAALGKIIVRDGDTLWDLARKHRVSLRSLIAVNRLKSEVIVPGKELLLPEPAP